MSGEPLGLWSRVYAELGLYVWPGYIKGRSKMPSKAPELSAKRVSFYEQVTTPPAEGWTWRAWSGVRALVGHVPGMARVPLAVIDLDNEQSLAAWRDVTGEEEGRESVPISLTNRGLHAYYRMPADMAERAVEDRPGHVPTAAIPGTARTILPGLRPVPLTCEVLAAGKWVALPPSKHPKGGWYERAGTWGGEEVSELEDWPVLPGWAADALRAARPVGRRFRAAGSSGSGWTGTRPPRGPGQPDAEEEVTARVQGYYDEHVAAGSYRGGGTAGLRAALDAMADSTEGNRTDAMLKATIALGEAFVFGLAGPDELAEIADEWGVVKPGDDARDDFYRALERPMNDSRAYWEAARRWR